MNILILSFAEIYSHGGGIRMPIPQGSFPSALEANIYDRDFEKIKVLRGQTVTSRKTLAKELGMSEMQVRTSLDHLKSTGEITTVSHAKYTLITVVNYDLYQSGVYKPITKYQPTLNQLLTTKQPQLNNKNNNNKNNNKNNKYAKFKDDYCLESSFDADEFFKVAVEHSKRQQKAQMLENKDL